MDHAAASVTMQELVADGDGPLCVISTGLADYDGARMPADFCCVVDVSGSMGVEAEVPTAGGAREQTGLSVLDVVRHAVRTIVHILGPEDRLALVAYDTTAEIVFDLTKMGEGPERTGAEELLDALRPKAQTNLWAGLTLGLDVLGRAREADGGSQRISAVLLLTDGIPNEVPEGGHLPALQAYKERTGGWLPTICTFGFGYELDSELLQEPRESETLGELPIGASLSILEALMSVMAHAWKWILILALLVLPFGRKRLNYDNHRPSMLVYLRGSQIIEFLAMRWRRTVDLHGDGEWRRQVHKFLMKGVDETPRAQLSYHRSQTVQTRFSEINREEKDRLMLGQNSERSEVNNRTATRVICIDRPFNKDTDNCFESSYEDYKKNTCWICTTGCDEWEMWISCKHLFCKRCSTEMLQRRMPCPLCRVSSSTVLRGKHPEAA